jgi:hypothetical protein
MAVGGAVGDAAAMHRITAKLLESLAHLAGPTLPIDPRLVVCDRCGDDFVHPVSWHEQDETHWWIRLRCGQCDRVREVEVTDEQAKRFDSDLNRGAAEIAAALNRLDRERMIVDSDTLTAALERDLIDPSDFCH